MSFASRHGVGKQFVEAYEIIPFTFLKGPTKRTPEEGQDYFYYSGPVDSKTREFCKYMMKLGKVFSSDEIEFMSDILGYPVLKYAGSYNCRHSWVKFRGKVIKTPAPTVRQIDNLIEKNINFNQHGR